MKRDFLVKVMGERGHNPNFPTDDIAKSAEK